MGERSSFAGTWNPYGVSRKRRADERKTALFPVDGSLQEGDLDRFVDRICTDHIKKGICKDQRKEKEMKHRLITIVGWLFLVTSVGLLLYSEDHFFYQTETIRSDRTGTGEKYGKKKKR